MTKKTLIITVIAIIVLTGLGLVFAKSDEQVNKDKQAMIDTRAKAWEKKYEELSKKELASKLLAEAEQARIEKEKLLGLTGSSGGLIQ